MVDVAAPKPGDANVDARHDSLEDETEVWNVTVKPIRIPNHQIIMGKSSTRVRGWGIWKSDDVIRAWLKTGALTETDPGEQPPPPESPETSYASFPAAPNVFSGRVEPIRPIRAEKAPSPEPKEAPQAPKGSSPSPGGLKPSPGPSPARP
jgi:hypothetical protein